ncbi:MAG: FxsA family protein, partial [Solirubrobacterales bacterium]
MPFLVAALIIVPLIEIFVIIQVGQLVGPWWTIALLILSSVIGAVLMKREGSKAWE